MRVAEKGREKALIVEGLGKPIIVARLKIVFIGNVSKKA